MPADSIVTTTSSLFAQNKYLAAHVLHGLRLLFITSPQKMKWFYDWKPTMKLKQLSDVMCLMKILS